MREYLQQSDDSLERKGDAMINIIKQHMERYPKMESLMAETLNEMLVQPADTKVGTAAGQERNLEQFLTIFDEDEFLRTDRSCPIVIAIDGMAGAGKSVLGQLLQEIYHCNLFHMDDFFLQSHQRTIKRLAEPGGNVDYERFKSEVLECLYNPEGLWYQKYDCSTQSLKEKEFVPYNRLVIIEGAYSLHPYFEDRVDFAFFLEIPDEIQIERIRKRNGEKMLKRFVEEWIPMERRYFETFNIREKADLVLSLLKSEK